MDEKILLINSVPTKIIYSKNCFTEENGKLIVIVITGNPGIVEYYRDYVAALYNKLSDDVDVICIGHAGHSYTPDLTKPKVKDHSKLYDLEGQVEHKLDLIKNILPKNRPIALVGHSIGAYIVLELLKRLEGHCKVVKSILLFPTIEKMRESPNGKFIWPFLRYMFCLMLVLNNLIYYLLPTWFLTVLIKIGLRGRTSKLNVEATMLVLKPDIFYCISQMALDELIKVEKLCHAEELTKYKNSIVLYYGTTDDWVPVSYYVHLKEKVPGLRAILCPDAIPHSFTLTHSNTMATKTAAFLAE